MCLYAYAGDDPTAFVDPEGTWGKHIHFVHTQEWCVEEGFTKEKGAHVIAVNDWLVDARSADGAANYHKPFDTNRKWHGWPQGSRAAYDFAESIRKRAIRENSRIWLGRSLHAMQDYFCHQGRSHKDPRTDFAHWRGNTDRVAKSHKKTREFLRKWKITRGKS